MLLPILLSLSTSQASSITFEFPEQSPYSLNSEYVPSDIVFLDNSDTESSESIAKDEKTRRFNFDSKYDKRFMFSHRMSKFGIVTMGVGGGVAVIGIGVMITGFIHSILIWDASPLLIGGGYMALGGSVIVGLGFVATSIGSVTAGFALKKMGEDVPFTGLYIAASGVAVLLASTVLNTQTQELQRASEVASNIGAFAIPVGFVWQVVQNNRSYKSYMAKSEKVDFRVYPQINHMGFGAVAQLTF